MIRCPVCNSLKSEDEPCPGCLVRYGLEMPDEDGPSASGGPGRARLSALWTPAAALAPVAVGLSVCTFLLGLAVSQTWATGSIQDAADPAVQTPAVPQAPMPVASQPPRALPAPPPVRPVRPVPMEPMPTIPSTAPDRQAIDAARQAAEEAAVAAAARRAAAEEASRMAAERRLEADAARRMAEGRRLDAEEARRAAEVRAKEAAERAAVRAALEARR